ncbi:hypothetical protein [Streptomyces sp. ALB3]|uniref:hypothetical protein n=1 Tax=Streptomyces sp. ALB3 TaxID=3374278 RepID=UPI0037AB58DB
MTGKGAGRRALFIALAAALVFGIAGGGTAYLLNQDDEKQTQGGSSPRGGQEKDSSGTPAPDAKPADTSEDEAQEEPAPEPSEYKGINLTAGYHLTLADEDVRPQEGEDAGYELSYDTGGYLDAESTGGKLVLLDPAQQGSFEVCRADTRFAENIATEKLSKGRQVCVFTGTGHMGLVTVQGFSAEDSPSEYMSLDLTVWRNAAG